MSLLRGVIGILLVVKVVCGLIVSDWKTEIKVEPTLGVGTGLDGEGGS